jgi:hypothetical protein
MGDSPIDGKPQRRGYTIQYSLGMITLHYVKSYLLLANQWTTIEIVDLRPLSLSFQWK